MCALSIRDEGTGESWRVWPDAEPIPAGAVHEKGTYLFEFEGAGAAADADLLIDDAPLEALRAKEPGKARWRWSPGFHAGTVEAELRVPGGGTRRLEVVTDPDVRKITRGDFDGMVREILEDTFALFSLSGFRKSVAQGVGGRAPPIARLEFLRSRIGELEEAAEAIARHPRRVLRADEEAVPYHRAARATGPEILRSFRSGRVLSGDRSRTRLPGALRGFVPERIGLRRRYSSLDIPEHRQMASCLRSWQAWLGTAAALLERGRVWEDADARRTARSWATRCRQLGRRIDRLCELPPFVVPAAAQPRLLLTPVFRTDPDYRRFLRLRRDMDRGIAAVFGDFLGMPLARTFELYELWCFLRLVRAAAEEYGAAGADVADLFVADSSGGVTVRAEAASVPIGAGWELCFQRTYREFWKEPDGRGSFSRTMRPDVTVSREQGDAASLIVLDAKYRIEEGLTEALNSIHTYRDALVREAESGVVAGIVTAAYLLAPHVPDPVCDAGYRDTEMPGRLFHPEYRRGFRFGAVTMRPGMAGGELREALRAIVADATSGDGCV